MIPPAPPPQVVIERRLTIVVKHFSVQYAFESAHLSATSIGFFMNEFPQLEILTRSCDFVRAPSHVTLANQSQFLSLRITKQRGSLRRRGVTFLFYENSSFLNTAINNIQCAPTLTKPKIQHFTDRQSL